MSSHEERAITSVPSTARPTTTGGDFVASPPTASSSHNGSIARRTSARTTTSRNHPDRLIERAIDHVHDLASGYVDQKQVRSIANPLKSRVGRR
jgi:hypothetical protein